MAATTPPRPGAKSNGAARTDYRLVPSGFAFLDRDIGGFRTAKRYALLAEQGAERYVGAMQMVRAGLDNGEVVLVLSAEDPETLLIQADRMRLPVARFLHGDQLMVLGYEADFADLVSNPTMQEKLLDDIKRKTNNRPINRVLMLGDPVGIDTNLRAQQAVERLESHFVHEQRATLIHVRGSEGDERRMREIVQRAFGVFELAASRERGEYRCVFRVRKEPAFAAGAVEYQTTLQLGAGLVQIEMDQRIPVLYFGDDSQLTADLMTSLGPAFDIQRHMLEIEAHEVFDRRDQQPIFLVELPPDDLRGTRALRLVEDIRRYTQAPIIVVAHSLARAADRIAFLRRGADDVLVQSTPLVEIRERVRRHAVRSKLIPPVTSRYLRLEVGADLPRSGEYGTVQWGVFKENLESTIEAMKDLGGHFALLGIQVTDADPNGAPEAAAGVARKVTQELVQILRDEDAAAIAPDGLLVVRLHTATQREVQFVLQRAATRLAAARIQDSAIVDIVVSAAIFPQDGDDAAELLQQLHRRDRTAPLALPAGEPTQKVKPSRESR